jgi:hypothetical protein
MQFDGGVGGIPALQRQHAISPGNHMSSIREATALNKTNYSMASVFASMIGSARAE